MQERELAARRHEQQAVGLCHAARHLGQKLRPRDPDRDRQADLCCARRPAAGRRSHAGRPCAEGCGRRGTPRRSRGPRPAASCPRRRSRRRGSPRCMRTYAARPRRHPGRAGGPHPRSSACRRRGPSPRSSRRARPSRRRAPACRATLAGRAARPQRRTSRGRRGGSSARGSHRRFKRTYVRLALTG